MDLNSPVIEKESTETKETDRKLFQLGKQEVTASRLKWAFFFSIFVIALMALVAIIIYTEVYVRSFHIRVDCYPDTPLNFEKCLDRGCIWVQRHIDLEPPCFFPEGYGYRYKDNIKSTDYGFHLELERHPKTKLYGNESDFLNLVVTTETKTRLRFKFADKTQKRYEVPLDVPPPPVKAPSDTDYNVSFTNDPQFGIEVKRVSTGTVIFDTNVPGMVFSDQYLQITTKLPSANIYGLGEHLNYDYRHSTNWKNMSFFSRDISPYTTKLNLYGVHPFYMNVEEDGNAHGVFLLNSNAMEVVIQPYPALTFRTIGGILDFFIFMGPTPEDVIKQYLEVIGLPMMPPYWSLGFHLSRFGYDNTDAVREASNRMLKNQIPYDVQHLDIDYMQDYLDFTVDDVKFNGLKQFIEELHNEHDVKLITIIDPAISSKKSLSGKYPPLDIGESLDIFIKLNGKNLEGEVWPGKSYYPDFSHPKAVSYWSNLCSEFKRLLPYDGIWIDMNEPSSFVPGSRIGCDESNPLNYPPYACNVLGSEKNRSMFEKTICMEAMQHAGRHYDVHSLYGFFEANVTYRALLAIMGGHRPFVLSRSTYPGAGRYAAHWLGDNFSGWSQLQASIPGILDFNLFGIPMVGSDICGFNDNVTEELCFRWTQLGAFYPFCRNHNTFNTIPQDPASMGPKVLEAAKKSLATRYELLPYLYTLFHFAHTEGSTVARPLLHEFPTDKNTWSIKHQFLWGPALLISPVVYEKETTVDAYFPDGVWYSFYTGAIEKQGEGKTLTLTDNFSAESKINVHVRGGYILPVQIPALTTTKSRQNNMGLFIAPDKAGNAVGLLFWDDGISYETQEHKKYLLVNFKFSQVNDTVVLSSNVTVKYNDPLKIGYLTICRQSVPTSVTLNEKKVPEKSWKYSRNTQMLRFESLDIPANEDFILVIVHK